MSVTINTPGGGDINDLRRKIKRELALAPPETWTALEAGSVLTVLRLIVSGREIGGGQGDVIPLSAYR